MHLKGEDVRNKKKLRIIIIEDDPTISQFLKTALSKLGHHVLVFPDPKACPCPVLKKTICFCPQEFPCADVVISDIVMPNMTGIDFFKLQRERGCKAPDANKALMSGTIKSEYIEAAKELGCKFFKKPFKLIEIFDWIEECAERIPEGRVLAKIG